MATPATVNPFNFYPGRDGTPLQGGYLYFGEPFQDPELQPLQAYWDDANTQPAARPIRTINGYPARNGAPAQVFVAAQYSMRARDSQGREVFYAPNVTAVDLGGGGLDVITASGGQTVITLTNAIYTPGSNAVDVSLNGLILISGQDYFETGTNRITMASALTAGDQVRVFARSTFGLTQAVLSDWQAEMFSGNGAASQNFSLTRNPGSVANLDISVAGQTLRPLLDYTLSGQVVTITPAPVAGTNNVLIRNGRSLPQDALRGELADPTGASNGPGLIRPNATLNYAAGTLGTWYTKALSIKDFPWLAKGDDVTDDSLAIQAAIDFAHTKGAKLLFPYGKYLHNTTLVFKNNVHYCGAGIDADGQTGTVLHYTGASDAVQINNPINSSTSAYIKISDMYVKCSVLTSGKASIADVGSTYLTIERVRTFGNDHGLILDQSEVVRVQDCVLSVPAAAKTGLWIVNGADHTAGALPFFTNRIKVSNCQFDASTAGQCIADDGGVAHVFTDNNFNGGGSSIRLTNVQGLQISGNELEVAVNNFLSFNTTTLSGGVGNYCTTVQVSTNYFSSSAANPCIVFQAGSVLKYIGIRNTFNNTNAAGAPYSGVSAGVSDFFGACNVQLGAGSAVVGNTISAISSYTPSFASSNADASLGNGTIVGTYVRTGQNVTATINFTFGSTTTKGTGQWRFGLPFAAVGSALHIGSFIGLAAGAAFKAGSSDTSGGATYARAWENGVGPLGGASYAWANGDFINITITYPVSQSA